MQNNHFTGGAATENRPYKKKRGSFAELEEKFEIWIRLCLPTLIKD